MGDPAPQYDLGTLAARFDLQLHGAANTLIDGVGSLAGAGSSQLAFLADPRYSAGLADTSAGAVVVAADQVGAAPVPVLVASDPHVVWAKIAALFQQRATPPPGIHDSAVIADGADVSDDASIGPFCVLEAGAQVEAGAVIEAHCTIGRDCHIGAHSQLLPRVTLCDNVRLGQRVRVHPGAVLGSDGFGLAVDGDHWIKVPQLGGVRIGDDCEIGAGTTVDRGTVEDTVLEDDVRLDNQIQIAHNVRVGAHTAMAGCCAVAGSAHIGRWCMIGGNAGILGHLTVADHVVVTAKSLVTRSIHESGHYSSGVPLQKNKPWRKNAARFRQLDDMARRLKALERKQHD